jgi:hypothetical protein
MMRGVGMAGLRIQFRYLLPLLFLPLTAALISAGRQQQQGIDVGNWDGPPPRPFEIAVAINLPAGIAAVPGGLLFEFAAGGSEHRRDSNWRNAFGYSYFLAFVFGQWFLVGRWFDRRNELLPSSTTRSVSLRSSNVVHVTALVGSLFFICFGIWHILHSGWMSSWISGAGITAWGSIAAIAITFRLRRLISSAGQDASHRDR